MKKTAKTLSIVIMAFAMAMCFFFAGLTFIKADTNATEEVGLTVLSGAEVYVPDGNLSDVGIRFTVQIPEEGYQTLANLAGENGAVHLGVEFGSKVSGEFASFTNGSYTVKSTAPDVKDGNMQYTFTLKYNLERIFKNAYPGVGYIESMQAENYAGNEDIYTAQQGQINAMYLKELCIRPWYKTITANGEVSNPVNGNAGDSRSMLHVAIAEINEYDKKGNTVLDADSYAYFTSTYLNGEIDPVEGDYTINAFGETNILLLEGDDAPDTYILESSGEVVARKGATSLTMGAHLGKYKEGDVITLYGIKADRKVVSYTATYTGFEGMPLTSIEGEQPIISAEGKMYLNNTGLEKKTIDGVFYNGLLVSKDGENIDLTEINEAIGSEVKLVIKVGETLYNGTSLYVTKAFENTFESKKDMTATLGTSNTSYKRDAATSTDNDKNDNLERGTLTGYYALAEDITFYDANDTTTDWSAIALGGRNEDDDGNSYGVNIFNATFDGRGHSLNNIILDNSRNKDGNNFYNYGIFGMEMGVNAKLMNFAINGAKFLVLDETTSQNIITDTNNCYVSALFAQKPSAVSNAEGNTSEMSNVYVNIEMGGRGTNAGAREMALFSDGHTDSFGFNKISNTIINFNINKNATYASLYIRRQSSSVIGMIAEGAYDAQISDTYLIINGRPWGQYTPAEEGKQESYGGIYTYSSVAKMPKGNEYYNNFSSDYWTISDGIPVWNTCSTIVAINSAIGVENVSSATKTSTTAGENFAITLTENGVDKTSDLSFDITGDKVVEVTNNTISVKNNVKGTAIVTVSYEGNTIATYTFEVDTRETAVNTEEILLSKRDGKLYFNNTTLASLKDATINDVALVNEDDTSSSIFADGKIDTSNLSITDGKEGSPVNYIISIDTNAGKYLLTNVKVYDGVFDNENASSIPTVFSASQVTGIYALAENIDLSGCSFKVTKSESTFSGIFDGRGYTMSNYYCGKSGAAIFGLAGDVTIKNVAINGITFSNGYGSVLFTLVNADSNVVIENVYFNAKYSTGYSNASLIIYNNEGDYGTWNVNNLFAEVDFEDGVENKNAALFKGYRAASGINGTFTNAYLLSTGSGSTATSIDGKLKLLQNNETLAQARGTMVADEDYNPDGFDSKYWEIGADGAPRWKSCSVWATVYNNNEEAVNLSETLYETGATYTVKVNGEATEIEVVGENPVVSTDGNTFTVLANKKGNSEIVVTYNGNVVDTFIVKVDTAYRLSVLKNNSEVQGENIATDNVNDEFTVKVYDGEEEITEGINLSISPTSSEMVSIDNGVIKAVAGKQGSAEINVSCQDGVVSSFIIYIDTAYHVEVTLGDSKIEVADGTEINYTNPNDKLYINLVCGDVTADVNEYSIASDLNEGITVSDNQLVIEANLDCTANVTVTWAGGEVTFVITINTKTANEVTEEVLLSKFDGKLYLNGTNIGETLKFEDITEVIDEDGNNILSSGKINTEGFTEIGDANKYSLTITAGADDVKYEFKDNVIVCTDVFDDTPYGRARMATKFGAGTSPSVTSYTVTLEDGSTKTLKTVKGDLTGYYALAEDLYFNEYNLKDPSTATPGTTPILRNEMFGGRQNYNGVITFDATFDGRGHTLNNVILDAQGTSHAGLMFGTYSGPNAVLKNFAINGVKFYLNGEIHDAPQSSNIAFFFYYPSAVVAESHKSEISNVYINVKMNSNGKNFPSLFYNLTAQDGSSTATVGFKTWSNVVIIYEVGTDLNSVTSYANLLGKSTGAMPTTKEEAVSFSNTYFVINGRPSVGTDSIPKSYAGLKWYMNTDAMFEDNANNDYSNFTGEAGNGCWEIGADGLPAWKTLPKTAQ